MSNKSAGKLFPRDMGDYDPATVYDLVDFVAHTNSLWCCLQPGTCGIEPSDENKAYWHCIISAQFTDAAKLGGETAEVWRKKIDDIINGVTTVGNAKKLNDKEASEYVEIQTVANMVLSYSDVAVDVSDWVEDESYADYPYKADITCDKTTAEYCADVIFDVAHATSGNFAPIAVTNESTVTIYANEIPTEKIVIPTIKCVRKVEITNDRTD